MESYVVRSVDMDVRWIEAFEMWIWRRMERISWTQQKANGDVLKQVEEKISLMDLISARQKNWTGHIVRGELSTKRNNGEKSAGE